MALGFPLRGPQGGPVIGRLRQRAGRGTLRARPIGRPIISPTVNRNNPLRARSPIGREGPGGIRQFLPGGGSGLPPIKFQPKPPPPPFVPGRTPGRPPSFGGPGRTDIVRSPYLRDLRQGISPEQYARMQAGHLPGMEHGDFVGLGRQELQRLAGTLHQAGGQYTSAPVWPGLGPPGYHPPIPPIGPEPVSGGPIGREGPGGIGRFLPFRTEFGPRNFGQFRRQFNLNRQLMHPIDEVLGQNHGLHPAAVQLLRDQYDNDLLQAAAQQGGMAGPSLYG